MKEVQEFAANHAAGLYPLNIHVLGLNYSSTEAEMIKSYRYMARRFHPDNNLGFDTLEMMKMINTAKDGLQDQLRENDACREEERVQATEYVISIHNSDSESSDASSEPASLPSKESTLPAKHTDDNEETPLKKSHP